MLAHFPAHAERCAILGGDGYLLDPQPAFAHWELLRFGEVAVADFLSGIDFFVYFTNPLWRESFGRVIVEAIAAGKVVITDPGTAATFGEAVVASDGEDVDRIIRGFIADPRSYVGFVEAAQERLAQFQPAAFVERLKRLISDAIAEGG
jgi:glycosyltransferase involved in cell wall biosynthesis